MGLLGDYSFDARGWKGFALSQNEAIELFLITDYSTTWTII
jgi:hypothetical protein